MGGPDALCRHDADVLEVRVAAVRADDLHGLRVPVIERRPDSLFAHVQDMVVGVVNHVEPSADQRVPHLRGGIEQRVVRRRQHPARQHGLLVDDGDVRGADPAGDTRVHRGEVIALPPRALLRLPVDSAVNQVVPRAEDGDGNVPGRRLLRRRPGCGGSRGARRPGNLRPFRNGAPAGRSVQPGRKNRIEPRRQNQNRQKPEEKLSASFFVRPPVSAQIPFTLFSVFYLKSSSVYHECTGFSIKL